MAESRPPDARTFVRYAIARLRRRSIDLSFMEYIAESVRCSVEGRRFENPWTWRRQEPQPRIDVEGVVDDVIARAGLEVFSEPA